MTREYRQLNDSDLRTVRMIEPPEGKELSADEKWEYANFTDSFIFSAVLKNNTQITRSLINLFVKDLEIREIKSIRREKRQDAYHDSKTTFLDVEVILSDDTVVLIEMQVLKVHDFVRRMRYYRSECDVRYLEHGDSYGRLPNVIQIVICLFDPIGDGRYIYDCEMSDRFTHEPLRQNGQRIIFLNCAGYRGEVTDEQLDFVKYLRGEDACGILAKNINAAVCEIKYDETERKEFMRFEDYVNDRAAAAEAKGRKEGKAEGRKESKEEDIAIAFSMLRSMGTDEETALSMISRNYAKSPEEIQKILRQKSAAGPGHRI